MDAPGTLVVRVTPNPALVRAAFAREAAYALWALASIGGSAAFVLSRPGHAAVLAIAAIVVLWSTYVLVRTVQPARVKWRVLSMGVPTLVLDDLGITVRDVPLNPEPAQLSWTDCAAVVVSPARRDHALPIQPRRYVQFVPVSDDRVAGRVPTRDPRRDVVPGVSERGALLVWLELPGLRPDADEVAAWIRRRQPGLRQVGVAQSVNEE